MTHSMLREDLFKYLDEEEKRLIAEIERIKQISQAKEEQRLDQIETMLELLGGWPNDEITHKLCDVITTAQKEAEDIYLYRLAFFYQVDDLLCKNTVPTRLSQKLRKSEPEHRNSENSRRVSPRKCTKYKDAPNPPNFRCSLTTLPESDIPESSVLRSSKSQIGSPSRSVPYLSSNYSTSNTPLNSVSPVGGRTPRTSRARSRNNSKNEEDMKEKKIEKVSQLDKLLHVLSPFLDDDDYVGSDEENSDPAFDDDEENTSENNVSTEKCDEQETPTISLDESTNIEDGVLSEIRALQDLPAAEFLKLMSSPKAYVRDQPFDSLIPASDDYSKYLDKLINSPPGNFEENIILRKKLSQRAMSRRSPSIKKRPITKKPSPVCRNNSENYCEVIQEFSPTKKPSPEERRIKIFNKAQKRLSGKQSRDYSKSSKEEISPEQRTPEILEEITLGKIIPNRKPISRMNSVAPVFITIYKFLQQQGGIKIQIPESLEELLERGSNRLGLNINKAIKVRNAQTRAEIKHISELKDGDVVYLMTATDERRAKIFNQ